jgi:predicted RNA-binding protein with PUA domain
LLIDSELYKLYTKVFRAYCKLYSYSLDYYLDLKREAAAKIIEEGKGGIKLDKKDVPNKENNYSLDAFKILARRRPGIDLDLFLINSLDNLGNRDLDYNYN